ncbi:unnamed protein product [Caenorhabditis brenneri]
MSKTISLILLLLFVGNALCYMKNANKPVQHRSDPIGNEAEHGDHHSHSEKIAEHLNRMTQELQLLEMEFVKFNEDYMMAKGNSSNSSNNTNSH